MFLDTELEDIVLGSIRVCCQYLQCHMTICTTLLLMVYQKVTGVEDAGCKCKTCCLDWDDSRIVSHQPNGGVKPISKLTHDLILSITEPIPKSHRMVSTCTVPCKALLR